VNTELLHLVGILYLNLLINVKFKEMVKDIMNKLSKQSNREINNCKMFQPGKIFRL